MTAKQPGVPWAVCKSILAHSYSNNTNSNNNNHPTSYSDKQAPTARDCYVLTHDEAKTVCACNSNYSLMAVEEEQFYPPFMATLNRYNPAFTWTGLMESVGAMLVVLILLFTFTFAFYILPSYDKHKALLAVKKGLPISQRTGAYFATAEGKVYRAAHINMNRLSFCDVYMEVYKIRLRNDHLCLWWCCDDPGSNISHFIKVVLTVFYCLLFMFQIAYFYGREIETAFPDTLFAFLIAFETILPIWLCAWCISKIRPHPFTDEEIDTLVEEQMPIITKDQKWEDEYESDIEHGGDEDNDNDNDMDNVADVVGLFAVPEILHTVQQQQNNWDIRRVYTDIDEEIEYLEENYMPKERNWDTMKRRSYPLQRVGYVQTSSDESSVESYEERRGFEEQNNQSHWDQARDAVTLGFIPVNEDEEYDAAAANMLRENKKENMKQRRKERYEREGSLSSRLSSLFKRENVDKTKKNKKKKEKKRRRSSLMQLLSFGSKQDVLDDEDSDDSYDDEEKEDQYYDDDESETISERRNKKNKRKKSPAVSSMNAPMQRLSDPNRNDKGYIAIELERTDYQDIGDFIAVHLNAQRKYDQFNKIVQIARLHRGKIKKKPKLLSRMVETGIVSGDTCLIDSDAMIKRTLRLIKRRHPLFDEIESGTTDKNQKQIQKLLRKQDVINTVFAPIESGNNRASPRRNMVYSPAELRKLEELPNNAPSQRPQREKRTNIDDDLWIQSNAVYDEREIDDADKDNKAKGRGIDMDDIWKVTGALPPELISALEDPYDAWKEDVLKPVQKPLRGDEEEDYRDKLTAHFKRRRELLQRKYWIPRWCRYVVWLLLFGLIVLFVMLFLFEGNKLGATFLWIPDQFNNTECTVSISEQERFAYDYSLDESDRRNPACSPDEYQGSMPNCWDYRVRFSIASWITFVTSMMLVQPLYIALLALIAVTCLPVCKPCCISIRNWLCCVDKEDAGYKHFLGGTILISGDTNLEYGPLADVVYHDRHRQYGDVHDVNGDSKQTPLL